MMHQLWHLVDFSSARTVSNAVSGSSRSVGVDPYHVATLIILLTQVSTGSMVLLFQYECQQSAWDFDWRSVSQPVEYAAAAQRSRMEFIDRFLPRVHQGRSYRRPAKQKNAYLCRT